MADIEQLAARGHVCDEDINVCCFPFQRTLPHQSQEVYKLP